MLLTNIGSEFVNLFANMHWAVIVLLVASLGLLVLEAFIEGFGVVGILGITCAVGAIIVHAIISTSLVQVLFLILIVLLVGILLFFLLVRSAKKGVLSKTPIFESQSSIPVDYKEKAENKLKPLIGKLGIAETECKPVGKIKIEGKFYEAQSNNQIIQKGEAVKVVAIQDARIIIEKEKENENE